MEVLNIWQCLDKELFRLIFLDRHGDIWESYFSHCVALRSSPNITFQQNICN